MKGLVKHGWLWVLAALLAAGLWRVRFDVEVLNLLPDDVSVVRGLKLYQQHFANGRELVITVRARDADAASTAARLLAEHLRGRTNLVASAIWQPPWLEQPADMAELIACLWINQPPGVVSQLADRLAPGTIHSMLGSARDELATSMSPMEIGRLAYDPLGLTRLPDTGMTGGIMFGDRQDGFASADGTFRVVFVEPGGLLPNYRASADWLADVKSAATSCRNWSEWPAGVTVRYTGSPAFVAEIATGIEKDMSGSALGTLAIVALLFGWAHRRWLPLLWLLVLLVVVVAGTLALGGLIFGAINVVSLGFAAILLGLGVDYAMVLYQEAIAAPQLSADEVRRVAAPGIIWSAVTTAGAFLILNFGGLPGLSQLGSLVGLGVLLAAVVMLYAFLPVAARKRMALTPRGGERDGVPERPSAASLKQGRWVTLVIALIAIAALCGGMPKVDHSTKPLQLADCPAQTAMDELQAELSREGEPLMLVVSGRDENEVGARLESARSLLDRAVANHQVRSYMLPTALWPSLERQQSNRTAVGRMAGDGQRLRSAVLGAGFTQDAFSLTEGILRTWGQIAERTDAVWPTNASCRWLLDRVTARNGKEWLALGMVSPSTDAASGLELVDSLGQAPGVCPTGWTVLGDALLRHVETRFPWLLLATMGTITICLWFAFHRWREVFLSFATLGFSMLVLLATMGIAGWSWNLMNLMALPILLGAGVDYAIHVQLALRRHGGSTAAMRGITGRAVFLCAGTTVAGFGSLGWSGNAGLASLGLICSVGILCVYLSSVFLLPAWWHLLTCSGGTMGEGGVRTAVQISSVSASGPTGPSSFYRAEVWRLGLVLVRWLPASFLNLLCLASAGLYYAVHPRRREVVVRNLLPVVGGERRAAERAAHSLYRQFALKLADLWRFESGAPVEDWFCEMTNWEVFLAAQGRGRGVLLITPHLGNWEIGGPIMARRGVRLVVITQAEPGNGLTDLRIASRAKWGIETLVIGGDGFAFVEIIKRLQEGATVALLMDRPKAPGGVLVELFGRPFRASSAAAELARASGCALVGVTVVRGSNGYTAQLLPEFSYDRQALGNREARRELTQQILRAFEPRIRHHPDQWYHFVPIWPEQSP